MLKILWIFLGVGTYVLQSKSSFVKVTRGNIDSVNSYIPQTSVDGLTCKRTGFCHCVKDTSTATYIFDSMSLTGKCVRDYEIISERSSGKFLPRNKKCIGVTDDEKVKNLNCRDDDLSLRWIWTLNDQMLNLKALKCLKGERINVTRRGRRREITKLLLEQCDANTIKQKWGCKNNSRNMENKGVTGFEMKWIKQGNDMEGHFQYCNEAIYSYQGCYRFSDGNFMKLIDNGSCDTLYNNTCGLDINIQAPIATGYSSCWLDWTKSEHTISGYIWETFNEAIEGVTLDTTFNPVILQIRNKSLVISKWQGHLFRLYIECSDQVGTSESHCALLKIQGSAIDQIPIDDSATLNPPSSTPPTTSTTTSQTKSNSTSPMTSRYHVNMTSVFPTSPSTGTQFPNINSEDREGKDNLSIILPVVISAVVLFCLLLAVAIVIVYRRRKRKTDSNQNEEHVYEETHPVDNGPVSPIYMEIDDIKRRSKKSNGSRKTRSKSQASQEPPENPFYHTLERPDGLGENVIYEELDEVAKPPSPKPFEKELDV